MIWFGLECTGTLSILVHLPEALSQPLVYWMAGAAVAGGWLTSAVQSLLVVTAFDFSPPDHQPVISKHDWETR